MTSQEIRNGFNQMIAAAAAEGNADAVARMEIAREYLTNEAFKTSLQNHIWNINKARA